MFAVGQTNAQVVRKKVSMPREFNLRKKGRKRAEETRRKRKKGRKIYGAWVGDRCLYLSDEEKVLRAKAGREDQVKLMSVDTENRIRVPASLEHANVSIRGCISTIELQFTPQKQA